MSFRSGFNYMCITYINALVYVPFIKSTVTYVTYTATYRTLSTQQPTYLVNLLHFSNISEPLRSSDSKQPFVPKTKQSIGKHAFSVAAPIICNQLRFKINSSETINTFRKQLKYSCLKLLFHHNVSAAPCSNDNFYL